MAKLKIATKQVLSSTSFEETFDHIGVNNSSYVKGFTCNDGKYYPFRPIISYVGTTEPGNWGVPCETEGETFGQTIERFKKETGMSPQKMHVVETYRGMESWEDQEELIYIISSFKFKSRHFFELSDLSDCFPEVEPLVSRTGGMPDGEYIFRTSMKGERITYYVFENTWYYVETEEDIDHAVCISEYGLLPCLKEAEWECLSQKSTYQKLSPRWKANVRAWKWLKWKRDLRIEYFCSKSIPKKAFRKRK